MNVHPLLTLLSQMPVLIAATVASEKPIDSYIVKDVISIQCANTIPKDLSIRLSVATCAEIPHM